MGDLVPIGVVAKITGFTPRQIRYLERLGAIQPTEKRGQHRLYDSNAVELLHEIYSRYNDGQGFAQIARDLASSKGGEWESGRIKIGMLAEASGVEERLLRQFEDYGILSPERSGGGTRLYELADAQVAVVAAALLSVGVSFDELKALAHDRTRFKSGKDSSAHFLNSIDAMKHDVNKRIDVLENTRLALERAEVLIGQCANCPNRPNPRDCPSCPMEQHAAVSPVARLIWEH